MRDKLRIDIYTILMIAMVPTFLAVAWGLTWNHDRVAAKEACTNTEHYLAAVAEIAPVYTNAGTLQNADVWLTRLQEITPPSPARNLHDSVSSSISYGMNVDPELSTTEPAAVYDQITPFQQAIDKGRQDIVGKCPDIAAMIPEAFPMFFRQGNK